MPLSWNEIRHRAIAFSKEWRGETREAAERQSFWNDFFNVFGVRRRTVATFEEPVRKLSGDWGFIDLFWPGRLLAEHKSAGEDACATLSTALPETPSNPAVHDGHESEIFRTDGRGVVPGDRKKLAFDVSSQPTP